MAEKWTALLMKTGPDKEKQNIFWNMVGSFWYAFASMVLSFLAIRLAGEDQGGIFAFGYSTVGQQMFVLAYFGIRPFHITDGNKEYTFGDYRCHRYLTCILAVLAGTGYLLLSGFPFQKSLIIFLLVCYKVTDGYADVYESEFQRNGNLHLTGKSNTFRTFLSVGTFLGVLAAGRNLTAACAAMVAAQGAGVLLFNVAVIRQLNGVDFTWSRKNLRPLTAQTMLLFLSGFMDFYIFSSARYAIGTYMEDASSGYFNIIFMPTSVINLVAGFVIRPVLTDLTDAWNGKKLDKFSGKLKNISKIIGALSLLAMVLTAGLGKPVLWVLEQALGVSGGQLTNHYAAFILIVMGGACYAFLNLYYYVLVVMRKQKVIFSIYAVLTVLAAVLAPALVKRNGIEGAAVAYLILMVIMAASFTAWAWGGIYRENSHVCFIDSTTDEKKKSL